MSASIERPGRLKSFLVRVFEPVALFTAVIAVVTTAYAIVSYCQLRLFRESNEHAYRAWLTVKKVSSAQPIVVGSQAELWVEIENTGRSPAQSVRVTATTALQPRDWIIPGRLPDAEEQGVGVIGPSQAHSTDFIKKRPLNPAEVNGVDSGVLRIFWIGTVTYADQFGGDRLLEFCYFYDPPKPGRTVVGFPACSTHNRVR